MSEDKDAEIARLLDDVDRIEREKEAVEVALTTCSRIAVQGASDLDTFDRSEIIRRIVDRVKGLRSRVDGLESEVADLRKERDEALRQYGTAQDTIDALTLNDTERVVNAESRLFALAAAAREFREAEGCIVWTRAEQVYANVERFYEAANALDALLSGEEGR